MNFDPADHIAVMEYIEEKVQGLILHLPSPWQQDDSDPQFLDNEAQNIYRNPGRSANKLHRQFSGKIGEDTLKQIQSAIHLGAQRHVHNGFKERNTAVAHQSEYLVAFTWNNGKTPKEESGTFDTWKKHQGTKKIHIPIGSLSCVAGGSKLLTSFLEPQSSAAVEHTVEHTVERTDSIDSGCCSSGSASESFSQSSESQKLEKVSIGLKRQSPSGATGTKKPKLVNKHQSL